MRLPGVDAIGLAVAGLLAFAGAASAQGYPIAGTAPDRRPDGAPRIAQPARGAADQQRYLFGVTDPVPTTLGARDQGAWYTPFDRPGMPHPYDPRGWHPRTGQ
jgi:hypothetical protein